MTMTMRVPKGGDAAHAKPGRSSGESIAGCAVTDGCTLNDVGADGVTVESLSLQAAETNKAKIGSSAP
jgi:hypothetical protein